MESLPTMEHVDLLLFFVAREGTWQPLSAVSTTVTINPNVVAEHLQSLVTHGLLAVEHHPSGEARFSFMPRSLRERLAAQSLAEVYATRPVTLIRFVYDRPAESLQELADSFRVRKRDS
jgi:hypothetical protein